MNDNGPSRTTLDELPGRVLTFLRALGTSPTLRAAMKARGYTNEEHQSGWTLLHRVSGYTPDRPDIAPDADPAVANAIAALDAFDNPNFDAIQATLDRAHPDVSAFLFKN